MKVSDLTESERKVWEAAATGAWVDLRSGDSDLDSPERGSEWAPERIVRAEVIAALLIGDDEAASLAVRGVRLQGARITGDLTPASKTTISPPFQPFLYTLDLLLPVASLHQRDNWVAQGAAQWWSVFFIIMGWILATVVVASLTGIIKRNPN
jgi:hypothetical protein